MRKLYSLLLVLILVAVPVSTALGKKDLEYYFTCIAKMRGFANENPRTRDDAIDLATVYGQQNLEQCLADLSVMVERVGTVAKKAGRLLED